MLLNVDVMSTSPYRCGIARNSNTRGTCESGHSGHPVRVLCPSAGGSVHTTLHWPMSFRARDPRAAGDHCVVQRVESGYSAARPDNPLAARATAWARAFGE